MAALISAFFEKIGLSSVSLEILAFVSHCSANFQPILDCFIPNIKLKYEDLGNIKAFPIYIKSNVGRFFGTPGSLV